MSAARATRQRARETDAGGSVSLHLSKNLDKLPVVSRLPSGRKVYDYPLPLSCSGEWPTTAVVDMIMLHFSSEAPSRPGDPYDADRVIDIYRRVGVSAHYLIDREGNIFRLVDESRRAFHAGKGVLPWRPDRKDTLNNHSIGIEMLGIGSREDMRIFMSPERYDDLVTSHPEYKGFTGAQYESLIGLVAGIRARFPEIPMDRNHIVGHSDYAPSRRTDPGELFEWQRLGLAKVPSPETATAAPPVEPAPKVLPTQATPTQTPVSGVYIEILPSRTPVASPGTRL
jgi:N-acetyl-anhydromuramyl-L-alanine amidase AmpD